MEFGLSSAQALLRESVGRCLEDSASLERVKSFVNGDKRRAEDVWTALCDKTRRVGELVFDGGAADPLAGGSDPEVCARHRRRAHRARRGHPGRCAGHAHAGRSVLQRARAVRPPRRIFLESL